MINKMGESRINPIKDRNRSNMRLEAGTPGEMSAIWLNALNYITVEITERGTEQIDNDNHNNRYEDYYQCIFQ